MVARVYEAVRVASSLLGRSRSCRQPYLADIFVTPKRVPGTSRMASEGPLRAEPARQVMSQISTQRWQSALDADHQPMPDIKPQFRQGSITSRHTTHNDTDIRLEPLPEVEAPLLTHEPASSSEAVEPEEPRTMSLSLASRLLTRRPQRSLLSPSQRIPRRQNGSPCYSEGGKEYVTYTFLSR